ncbi:MAG TPA: hypothetical protein VKZ49_03060 [Polyangiaceae bacterium]|nr:hypothetical protein [Polyangiaceae bacterium]
MARPRKRHPLGEAELDQLLASGSPGVAQLCEAIRRCNPTGLPVDSGERRRRYALKARLQSALIERFGADLFVRPTPDSNIVGIGRREGRGDGGHARLSDLSTAARAWVADALGHAALVPAGRSKHKPR